MFITDGLLNMEIAKILETNQVKDTDIEYTIILHTPEKDIIVDLLESIEILGDYANNFSDFTIASFKIGMGDYIKDIYPNRDNLEITIKREDNYHDDVTIERFKFVMLNNKGGVTGTMYKRVSRQKLNETELIEIEGQCLDRHVEVMRTINLDGIFKNKTLTKLLEGMFSRVRKNIEIPNNEKELQLDIRELNNKRQYGHIQVPAGVNILDLPTFLNDTDYGLYNGGVGTYVKSYKENKYVFVYPLYDTTLYDKADKKLNIINVDTNRLDYVDSTYVLDGDIVKILAGSNTKNIDNGENDFIDTGVGIERADPSIGLERDSDLTDDEIKVSDSNHMNNQVFKKRRDKMNKTKYIGQEDNLFKHRKEVLLKTMTMFQIQWNFSNPRLIYPGMPVMYIYEDADEGIIQLKGILQSIYTEHSKTLKTTTSLINVLVQKPDIEKEE